MSEGQLDSPEVAKTLNDGTAAARAKGDDAKEAKDRLYTDILNTWASGANGARDQAADMARISDGLHEGNMLAGMEIVGVDDQNNLIIQDLDSGEQPQHVSQEQFQQLVIAPPDAQHFANGTELRVETDPTTGAITKVVTPAGEVVPGNGIDVDVTADGGVKVTEGNTETVYSPDGTWRQYNGSSSDNANLVNEKRYVQDQYGAWHLRTTSFDVPNGTVQMSQDGLDGSLNGHGLVMNADGTYSFQRDGDNHQYYFTTNGTYVSTVPDYADPSKPGETVMMKPDGSNIKIDYENGVATSLYVNEQQVANGVDSSSIILDSTTGDVTVNRADGSTDLYKNDGSVVHRIPAPSGSGQVVESVTYPDGNKRTFSGYDDQSNVPHHQTDTDKDGNVTLERALNVEGAPSGYLDSDGTYHYQEPGGAQQLWRTESSGAHTDVAVAGDPTVTEGDVQIDGPVTTTTWTSPDGVQHKKVENSELKITQEFATTPGSQTTVTITNGNTGEIVSGRLAYEPDENGQYRVVNDGQPSAVYDKFGRLIETYDYPRDTTTRLSYEDDHTATPRNRVTVGIANADGTRPVEVFAIASDGTETKIDGGNTVPTEGGKAQGDYYLQYQREDGTIVNRDGSARVTYEKAPNGTTTMFSYGEGSGSTPIAAEQNYPDGSSLKLEDKGDGDGKWSVTNEIAGSGAAVGTATDVKVDPATGELSYKQGATTVERDAAGNARYSSGNNEIIYGRGDDGSVNTIIRNTASGSDQFTLGEDGVWQRLHSTADSEQGDGTEQPMEPIDNLRMNTDGSFQYTDNHGISQVREMVSGGEERKDTFANGDVVVTQRDAAGNLRSWTATDGETGYVERVTYPLGEDAQPKLEVKDKDGNVVDIDPDSIVFDETGAVSYTTPDGQRIQQSPDGARATGKPNEDNNGFAQFDNVEWHEADGSLSSRSYTYDEEGNLTEATGTGTAANEQWTQQPDGTFKRESDGLVAALSISENGTFSSAYRDEEGQVKVFEQRPNGQYRTRDSVPVEKELASGRKVWVEEDGSMYGEIGQDSWYSAMAWDCFIAMHNLPTDSTQWSDEDWANWQAFSNKGYHDNAPTHPVFADNPDLVQPDEVFVFQRTGQTGPIAAQGENEPAPDEVPWESRSYESLTRQESPAESDGTAGGDTDGYDEDGETESDEDAAATPK